MATSLIQPQVTTGARWLRFNLVGIMGVVLQLAALGLFSCLLRWPYTLATTAAVELTILHNFLWHERFTWVDRRQPQALQRAIRLLRFQVANGTVSLVGNFACMWVSIKYWRLPVLLANVLAIGICALANFVLGDQFVFQTRDFVGGVGMVVPARGEMLEFRDQPRSL